MLEREERQKALLLETQDQEKTLLLESEKRQKEEIGRKRETEDIKVLI